MKWTDEDQRNRVTSAINTLAVMITFKKWDEAVAIIEQEIDWIADPAPDIIYNGFDGWPAVHNAMLVAKYNATHAR